LEDSLEKEMAAHPSILAWEIPWTEEPGTTEPLNNNNYYMSSTCQALDVFQETEHSPFFQGVSFVFEVKKQVVFHISL